MSYETENWPVIAAKYFGPKRSKASRLVVVHTPEWAEHTNGAEELGRYLAAPESPKSYHVGVDSDTIVQYVKDSYVAYAAPGCNNDGMQVAITGFMAQSKAQWLDRFSICACALAADVVAQYCLKYNIPAVHLTNEQLAAGDRGIIGHYQASQVYKKSDHTDPGPNFPWSRFITAVAVFKMDRA